MLLIIVINKKWREGKIFHPDTLSHFKNFQFALSFFSLNLRDLVFEFESSSIQCMLIHRSPLKQLEKLKKVLSDIICEYKVPIMYKLPFKKKSHFKFM